MKSTPGMFTGQPNALEICLAGALEVALVVELLDGLLGRIAADEVVGEGQLADAGVDGFCPLSIASGSATALLLTWFMV